ncbi:MAG: hypothetical protein Q4F95_01855 [Oscillospiraceae bacterium]|nr:hypothetical protein [Oscillospiraceae bacterium]
MGLFKGLKRFFSGTQYRINKTVLIQYANEVITFCKQENLSFCDEFLLSSDGTNDKLRLVIINFDAPCETTLESEECLTGIIIFLCKEKRYNPEIDEKYYSIEDFVSCKLMNYPEWFIMTNDLGEPTSLEKYKL